MNKLKEVENLVSYKYMRQNGHSQDINGRDEEYAPQFSLKFMEYLESFKDAPVVPNLNRTARLRLQHNNVEHTLTGVTTSLHTTESDDLRSSTTQHHIRNVSSSSQPGVTTTHHLHTQIVAPPEYPWHGPVISPQRRRKRSRNVHGLGEDEDDEQRLVSRQVSQMNQTFDRVTNLMSTVRDNRDTSRMLSSNRPIKLIMSDLTTCYNRIRELTEKDELDEFDQCELSSHRVYKNILAVEIQSHADKLTQQQRDA